jgi:DNA-binding Lrp family transcriptional regulator
LKDVELKIICSLMKNGRKSDREIAKDIGSSQPTVTRLRKKLEEEGIIKEYTVIPDFRKLGFEIAAVTLVRFVKQLSAEEYDEVRRYFTGIEKDEGEAILMAMNGLGLGYDRVFISFHRDYASYVKAMNEVETFPYGGQHRVESFLINLLDEEHFQPLTLSVIANYLLKTKEEKS